MCGILTFTKDVFQSDDLLLPMRSAVAARGPDHYGSIDTDGLTFESSVLMLRPPFTAQPLEALGSVLCYNGQIYDLPEDSKQDTHHVLELLRKGSINELMQCEGEFAFVYYNNRTILFGRDIYGRRSLLYHLGANGHIIICSVGSQKDPCDFVECDAGGVLYEYSLDTKSVTRIQIPVPALLLNRNILEAPDSPQSVLAALRNAVMRRTVRPELELNVAVMFSGGLDCSLIAAILDDVLPAGARIDLLNVAFENKRTGSLWDTPDRLLARRSLSELKARSKHADSLHVSNERFRLIEINVPYSTTQEHKPKVQKLMAPNSTVMDLSIALAFYFAAQPQRVSSGEILGAPGKDLDTPKIMFSGLGADELFAGYSRHTTAAETSPSRLVEELTLDFERLPHRNLGRDDRVASSWGREVRYPFLDQQVVDVAAALPVNYKIDEGITKVVLRQVAQILGFTDVVHEKKRAIQFGARSAKMDPGTGSAKGHHSL